MNRTIDILFSTKTANEDSSQNFGRSVQAKMKKGHIKLFKSRKTHIISLAEWKNILNDSIQMNKVFTKAIKTITDS